MASFEKRGKNYRAVVSVMKNGVRKKVSKSFETKKKAKEWATLMESDKIQGKNLIASNMLFGDYFEFWMNTYKKNDVREMTYRGYLNAEKNIKIIFEGTPLSKLTAATIQSKLDSFGKNHAQQTMVLLVAKIKASLKDALYDGYIQNDIFSRIKPHGVEDINKIKALSASNFEKLCEYLYSLSTKGTLNISQLAILVGLETGMRMGEILALTRDDLAYNFNTINITKSITPTRKITEPKNKNSYRSIKINNELMDILISYKSNNDDDLIFNISRTTIRYELIDLIKNLNLENITVHGLRHSHASYLLYNKISINYISSRLGHSNTSITQQVYAHMLKEEELDETNKALALLKPRLTPMSPNVPIVEEKS